MQFETHMSDAEALMWNLERDPALSSWFASLTILDKKPDFDHLRAKMAVGAAEIVRLRQKVAPGVGRLSPPEWVLDPEFDIDYHIRRAALPKPGTDRQLFDLASQLLLDPFERTRPLWQFVVIEGLSKGRAAVFQKMHHTITDGEGGVRLAEKFMELTPDDPTPPMPDFAAINSELDFSTAAKWTVGHNARRINGLVERGLKNLLGEPVKSVTNIAAVVGELSKALAPATGEGEVVGSPLWTERSLRRYYGAFSVPFAPAKAASKSLGGTLNDFFVAGALAGAAVYHESRGSEPNKLRIAMPMSTRKDGSAGGNQFALTTTDMVPVSDPVKAFAVVNEAFTTVKSGGAVDIIGSLSMIINLLPASVITKFARDQAATVDFTVSNVRGAPIEVYIAGAKVVSAFPMGPISGTGFNLTTLSYNGNLDMGLVVDTGAIDNPDELEADIAAAYAALIEAGT